MKTNRIVKKPTIRREEILDSAGRLIYSKGYEQMTIQDILDDLNIAKGTIYHYFESKQALLEAFIDRMKHVAEKPLLPILQDPDRNAVEKLQGFFDTFDSMRSAHMAEIIRLVRVWYTDDNAIVRQKVEAAAALQRAPLLNQIVLQGIQEGTFTTAYPEQSGEMILALLQGMGNSHIRLLFALDDGLDEQQCVAGIRTTQAAYMDAIERVLGMSPNTLSRATPEAAQAWVKAFKKTTENQPAVTE